MEFLTDRIREEPDFLDKWLRPPLDSFGGFDRRMPPLMRGSDGRPLHLTRRQFEAIKLWAEKLRASFAGS